MRLGKGFVLVVLLMVMSAGVASAQGVSTSDTLWFNPTEKNFDVPLPLSSDITFSWNIYASWDSTLGAIAVPLHYDTQAGTALQVDQSVTSSEGNEGVTYGPLANSPLPWTLRTSLVNPGAQTWLLGLISFGQADPATGDTLMITHWKLVTGSTAEVIPVDSGLVGTSTLTMTTVGAIDYTPQWVPGTVTLGPTAVGDAGTVPLDYGLDQNFPNPFNAQTMISFSMPKPEHVTLKVYNVLGQEVVKLLDQKMEPAQHEILWDGNNNQGGLVASGTYFYSLKIGDAFEETRQMTLLK